MRQKLILTWKYIGNIMKQTLLLLLFITACTTTYNLNGTMSKMVIIPNNKVDVASTPNNTSTHTMEKVMQEDFRYLEEETKIVEQTKVINGDDRSREHIDNSEHTTDVDTDVNIKNKTGEEHE